MFLFLTCTAVFAVQPGDRLPAFTVQADNSSISSSDITGRVAIITYETKGTVAVNQPFKKAVLSRWRQTDPAAPAIVPVINCASYFGFVRSICASRVAAAAKKENLVIYTDCDGAMQRAFKVPDDQSTILVVDKNGVVRFRHVGLLDAAGVQKCMALLEGLLRQ